MRLTLLFLLLLPVLLPWPRAVQAQGYNAYSGRNHPELEWQVAETEHFEIMYPAHLAGIEVEAAALAEASYAALAENLDVTFDERIRIYLSDEDEVANGFAVPIGAGYTAIWVHINDVAEIWSGREKWLREVIPHELAHIFHYRAVRSRPVLLAQLLADPLPRFWTEGLAQYQTETWDAQRGERWLRTAVLDDALSYNDARSMWNGRLLYAVGSSQVRFFAEQYGDSALVRLLHHRSPLLFGLARAHDFGKALRAVTDKSYRSFYDDWRRHVNVYYNTLAGQLETPDSLGTDPLELPGQYYFDVAYTPDTSHVAVLALTSLQRPVRRLYVVDRLTNDARVVADGAIKAPVSWSPDGRSLAFARTTRGRYGSLLNDLFLVGADGRGMRRLTRSRRASSPAFSPDGRTIAFVGTERGTSNVFLLDLATGAERAVTRFTGDVQLAALAWHPAGDRIAFSRFAADGARDVSVVDLATGAVRALTPGEADDRLPVWSPDGARLAYTSMRDDVPNVFVLDLATGRHQRVTALATGATAYAWLPPDSLHAAGTLVVASGVDKTRDAAYRIDAARTAPEVDPVVPPEYAAWKAHRPPVLVPTAVPADAALVTRRYRYDAWRNVTHVASLALPYYAGPGRWGVAGFTSWLEPLGIHALAAAGALSAGDLQESLFAATYRNNGWYPTLALSAYRLPGTVRFYGDDLLVERYTGAELTARLPLDVRVRPYVATAVGARVRYVHVEPLDAAPALALPAPQAGEQADLTVTFTRRLLRPWRHNIIHPLDGRGVRLTLTGAAPVLGADASFVRADASAFAVLPGPGLHRLFVYGRAQAQTGTILPQHALGFTRHDDVQIDLPADLPLTIGTLDRVRGYRRTVLGDRVLFGSVEYRAPLLSSLQTRLLGLVTLGATTAAVFADAGAVWTGEDGPPDRRLGAGVELKNALRLGGLLEVGHALGMARPLVGAERPDGWELYYRVRTAVPF